MGWSAWDGTDLSVGRVKLSLRVRQGFAHRTRAAKGIGKSCLGLQDLPKLMQARAAPVALARTEQVTPAAASVLQGRLGQKISQENFLA